MGLVFEAEDTTLSRRVALKVIAGRAGPDARARFLREARAAAALDHPNVVQIHDADVVGETAFLVMELVAGGSAADRLAAGPLPWPEATAVILDACRGLAAAHVAGMIHRDIKPANILLKADGGPGSPAAPVAPSAFRFPPVSAKLADFGLVKPAAGSSSGLTDGNARMGTAQYMSPEHCRGEPLDARSDLYSLGAAYHTLLTGRPPYAADEPMQVMFAHCAMPVPDPRTADPSIPAGCAEVVGRAMAKEPFDRYPTAEAMAEALVALLSSRPPAPRPSGGRSRPAPWVILLLTGSAAAVGTGALVLPPMLSGPPAPPPPARPEPPMPADVGAPVLPTPPAPPMPTAPPPPESGTPGVIEPREWLIGDHAMPLPAFGPKGDRLAVADAGYRTGGGPDDLGRGRRAAIARGRADDPVLGGRLVARRQAVGGGDLRRPGRAADRPRRRPDRPADPGGAARHARRGGGVVAGVRPRRAPADRRRRGYGDPSRRSPPTGAG